MKCGDKEWQHCRVEKMGCPGCYYNEIEVGEYVRYTGGYIDIVCEIVPADYNETDYAEEHIKGKRNSFITYDRIQKHSKNIIDLIDNIREEQVC